MTSHTSNEKSNGVETLEMLEMGFRPWKWCTQWIYMNNTWCMLVNVCDNCDKAPNHDASWYRKTIGEDHIV